MDRINLAEYTRKTMEALEALNELESEDNLYRLGIMHMNILNGDYSKVEQEFLRIDLQRQSTIL